MQMIKYNEDYYRNMVSGEPYNWESPVWRTFFGHVADQIKREFNPATVLDAGCAIGLLVGALRQRGVDAIGFDVSRFAIDEAVAHGLLGKAFNFSLDDSQLYGGLYDLVTCIEVVEHIDPEFADTAISNLCRMAKVAILFSSTPDDFTEPTHVNVQPEDYWLQLFARHGFVKTGAAPWLSKQAIILGRATK